MSKASLLRNMTPFPQQLLAAYQLPRQRLGLMSLPSTRGLLSSLQVASVHQGPGLSLIRFAALNNIGFTLCRWLLLYLVMHLSQEPPRPYPSMVPHCNMAFALSPHQIKIPIYLLSTERLYFKPILGFGRLCFIPKHCTNSW